jgi:hypothetical protein
VGDRQSVPHGAGVLGGGACPCPLMPFAIFIAATTKVHKCDSPKKRRTQLFLAMK